MLSTGSAINELAQSSSANAGYIVDFTADLAGVGRQAGMTQAQIMGLASALDQNMQEEATASTVFSQLITKMYQDPAKFAMFVDAEMYHSRYRGAEIHEAPQGECQWRTAGVHAEYAEQRWLR